MRERLVLNCGSRRYQFEWPREPRCASPRLRTQYSPGGVGASLSVIALHEADFLFFVTVTVLPSKVASPYGGGASFFLGEVLEVDAPLDSEQ